jgi:hypothetical protein
MYVDYLMLIPVEAGYGKATADYAHSPGVIVARDSFAGLGSGTGLSGRTPDVGAAWVSAGVATDFVGSTTTETTTTQPRVTRTTAVVEVTPRLAVFGSAMTNQEVAANAYIGGSFEGEARSQGVVARYVDSSNYLQLQWRMHTDGSKHVEIVRTLAGVATTLVSVPLTGLSLIRSLRLLVFTSGRAVGTVTTSAGSTTTVETTDSSLATAGALASGKAGLSDQNNAAGLGSARKYDDVFISTPAAEPIVLYPGRQLDIRSDSTIRESSDGTQWGRPPSYRGSRFRVSPAGDRDRVTRTVVLAHRNNLDAGGEWTPLTDSLTLAATFSPRCSIVPR